MTPITPAALLASLVVCAALVRGIRPRANARHRRHAYHIRRARQVIERLHTITHDGQKRAYLRRIDPLTFEEQLLEAGQRRGHRI